MATTSTPPPVEVEHVPPPPPHFINTVVELRGLSTSLSAFQRRYDDLQGHLEYIRNAIDSKLPKEISTIPLPEQLALVSSTKPPSLNAATKPNVNSEEKPMESASKLPKEINTIPLPEQLAVVSSTETPSPNAATKPGDNSDEKPMDLALEALCKDMSGRGLRKYITTQLWNAGKLREEVPKALKCAPNPAKLVLDSIGRFYLQGSSAYSKDSQMGRVREASVLTLECFLRMGIDGVEIEPAVKQEADIAAEAWTKRLKDEGGIPKGCELDARGLLFLISGFGIPRGFQHEPLRDLIRRSNPNAIYGVLRRSSDLISRIPGVLERMVRDKKHLGAVNMAYTFEVESSQLPVLKAFLQEMENVWIKAKERGAYTPLAVLNRANRIWLENMSSVVHCLKQKGLDHSKLLPEWKLDEKMANLKKEIADIEKEIKEKETDEEAKPKRKAADKTEPSKKSKSSKVKHLQHTGNAPQQQKEAAAAAAAFADRRNVYDGPTQINHLDSGFHGHINGYSASPYVTGSLPGNMAAVYGGPYGWHGDAALSERLVGPTFVGQPSSLGFNSMYRRPSPPMEGFAGLPDHHRSFEGFAGLPDHRTERVSGRSSASDLYQFADSVVEMESSRSGGSSRAGAGGGIGHKYNL